MFMMFATLTGYSKTCKSLEECLPKIKTVCRVGMYLEYQQTCKYYAKPTEKKGIFFVRNEIVIFFEGDLFRYEVARDTLLLRKYFNLLKFQVGPYTKFPIKIDTVPRAVSGLKFLLEERPSRLGIYRLKIISLPK